MDPVASGLTIVSAVWTLSMQLRKLIRDFKAQNEDVRKLEHKAETLETIIRQIQSAYQPNNGRTTASLVDSAEEDIRRIVQNVTSQCRDDLTEFVKELSKLLSDKKNGFRIDVALRTWRMQVAIPTFARIEKSIEGHQFSLQLLLNILHGRSLDAIRTVMEQKLNAIHNSTERMLAMLQSLAIASDKLPQQSSTESEAGPLNRRDTDVTLVAPPSDLGDEDPSVFPEDDSRLIRQIIGIFSAWLNQMNSAETKMSENSDTSIEHNENISLQAPNWAKDETRRTTPSSPDLDPIDVPVSPIPSRSPSASRDPESPRSPGLTSTTSMPNSPEAPTQIEIASRQLLEAVTKKDIEWMNILIDSELRPDLEFRDTEKKMMTPLLLAVKLEEIEIIKFLLSKGAKMEARDESGMTPFMLAASLNEVKIMKGLLARGADVHARDNCQRTALHVAIEKKSLEAVSCLLQLHDTQLDPRQHPDINATDKSQRTPLHYCINMDNLESSAMLLDRNANLEAQDSAKKTPAYYAIKYRRYFIVKLLIERGANFSSQWPPDATSNEIEKLLKRNGYTRPKLRMRGDKERSKSEGRIRKGSWLSLPGSNSRRSSAET